MDGQDACTRIKTTVFPEVHVILFSDQSRPSRKVFLAIFICSLFFLPSVTTAEMPSLPKKDGSVSIAAQESSFQPGPRQIKVYIHYPGEKLSNIDKQTGLMLTLHNWGGTVCAGTANPNQLANRYNVISICVDYLQSGRKGIDLEAPYDFGYLQALDALRALFFVYDGLKRSDKPFDSSRIYATGGSGGGNVTLMANKLAPRTFACIIDMCGMAKLNDAIAFRPLGKTGIGAGYSRDPDHPFYLSPDRQQLHFVGDPAHLKTMKALGNKTKIVIVHGSTDNTCPIADAREMVANMKTANLDIDAWILTKDNLDGKAFKSTGHSLGNRTEIVFKTADKYLLPNSPDARTRKTPPDFDRRDGKIRYKTANGSYLISYENGYPVGRFVK